MLAWRLNETTKTNKPEEGALKHPRGSSHTSSESRIAHSKGVTLRLCYLNLDLLKPHERFIETRVRQLLNSIRRAGYLMKPLIVDSRTYTVIDGAHRLEVLRRLKAIRAPVAMVDYLNEDEIAVDRWIRVYSGDVESLEKLLKLLKVELPGVITRRGSTILYIIEDSLGPDAYKILEALEGIITGIDGPEYRDRIPSRSHGKLAVVPPRLSKADVINAAERGELLPPKSTRHITVLKRLVMRVKLSELTSHA